MVVLEGQSSVKVSYLESSSFDSLRQATHLFIGRIVSKFGFWHDEEQESKGGKEGSPYVEIMSCEVSPLQIHLSCAAVKVESAEAVLRSTPQP